jgi:hypothetical protein
MYCDEGSETLIRYAGSASEASTDSRPIGSELRQDMYTLPPRCQVFPNGTAPSHLTQVRNGGCP